MYYLLGIVTLVVLWAIFTYNSFIARKNKMKQCESGICVALKQRNDMIPALVSVVKGYAKHEQQTLADVTALRSKAMETTNTQEEIKLGSRISAAIPRINALRENYPDLKADKNFLQLQGSIEEMELQLQAIRRTYNAAVTDFNNKVEMFPSSIIAGIGKFTSVDLIDIPEIEKKTPEISFN